MVVATSTRDCRGCGSQYKRAVARGAWPAGRAGPRGELAVSRNWPGKLAGRGELLAFTGPGRRCPRERGSPGASSAALARGRLLGEWHHAAPAKRYSARAMIDAARGIQARQRLSPTRQPATLFRAAGEILRCRPVIKAVGCRA